MVFVLSEKDSVANQFISELRDQTIQQDRMRFRKNVERLGQIMAYEISQKLKFKNKMVQTPLGTASTNLIEDQPVLITVMRAGLPYFQGFLNYFDHSDCGFIGAYRKEGEEEVVINLEYLAAPTLHNREIILIDPMLATGQSFVRSINALLKHGTPSHIHLVSLVAVPDGINLITKSLTLPYSIWTCVVDERLNDQFYIVPGLGDAGDLCFGNKL
ncbi:MAG: uracil phosphoribosyltransferase [Marivirga sp.]|nr:uracil phosphoribosyltransferase [Marivirga sp.]